MGCARLRKVFCRMCEKGGDASVPTRGALGRITEVKGTRATQASSREDRGGEGDEGDASVHPHRPRHPRPYGLEGFSKEGDVERRWIL